jgi:hypothetical protein
MGAFLLVNLLSRLHVIELHYGGFIVKKLLLVALLVGAISGCANFPSTSGYSRPYYPSNAYRFGYYEAYRYIPHYRH